MPIPMPARAIMEVSSSALVLLAAARLNRPMAASSMASKAVRSSPTSLAMRGVSTPNRANAAVGNMPNTPAMVLLKPNVVPSCSSSGVNEVTAVRRLKAESTMPASTRLRPDQSGLEETGRQGDCVAEVCIRSIIPVCVAAKCRGTLCCLCADHAQSDATQENRHEKTGTRPVFSCLLGRGDRIRTCDLYVPNLVQFATKSLLKHRDIIQKNHCGATLGQLRRVAIY